MEWIGNNWIWIAFALGFIALHMFGHGHGHRRGDGGHGCGRRDRQPSGREGKRAAAVAARAHGAHNNAPSAQENSRRRHGC